MSVKAAENIQVGDQVYVVGAHGELRIVKKVTAMDEDTWRLYLKGKIKSGQPASITVKKGEHYEVK